MSKMSDQNETFSEQRKNSPTGNLIVSSPKGWKLFLKVAHLFAWNSASWMFLNALEQQANNPTNKRLPARVTVTFVHFGAILNEPMLVNKDNYLDSNWP